MSQDNTTGANSQVTASTEFEKQSLLIDLKIKCACRNYLRGDVPKKFRFTKLAVYVSLDEPT